MASAPDSLTAVCPVEKRREREKTRGYTSQYVLSLSPSPEIGRVEAGRASGIRIP